MDKKEIRKKVLAAPLDAFTLLPFFVGTAMGIGFWAFSALSNVIAGTSLLLILLSAGLYLNRLILGWDKQYHKIVHQWREQVERKREKELDHLHQQLQSDEDPRTQNLLQDLRTLTQALLDANPEGDSLYGALDVFTDADRLFQRSVDYLRESLELWQTAGNMQKPSIKERLLAHREMLISEVEKSLENLGEVLARFKQASVGGESGQELAQLREELSNRLKIAEQVETRVDALRTGRSAGYDEEEFLKYAPK